MLSTSGGEFFFWESLSSFFVDITLIMFFIQIV